MTHQDLFRIAEVLHMIENMTMEQGKDPVFIGTIRASAFRASLPIKYEFKDTEIVLQAA